MQTTSDYEVLAAGEVVVRPADFVAHAGGQALHLSERELGLLCALIRRQGRVVPRAELYESVWGRPLRPSDRSVDVYVHKLRLKLAEALPGRAYIHTHFGFGYRLAPQPSSHPFNTTASPEHDAPNTNQEV